MTRKGPVLQCPRARTLQATAVAAPAVAGLPAVALCAYLTMSGGRLGVVGQGLAAAVLLLGLAGAMCAYLAPRLEAEYQARLVLDAGLTDQLELVEAVTPEPPPPAPVPAPAPSPAPLPVTRPATTGPVLEPTEIIPAPAAAQPVRQPAVARAGGVR